MFWPSTYPSSRSLVRKSSTSGSSGPMEAVATKPTTGTSLGCCAHVTPEGKPRMSASNAKRTRRVTVSSRTRRVTVSSQRRTAHSHESASLPASLRRPTLALTGAKTASGAPLLLRPVQRVGLRLSHAPYVLRISGSRSRTRLRFRPASSPALRRRKYCCR
jgi:hypothetical protein